MKMKKETREILESWWLVLWFVFTIGALIGSYFVHGWGHDLQFTLAIAVILGVPMAYFLLRLIKKKEFRLYLRSN